MRLLVLLLITFLPALYSQQTDAESDDADSTQTDEAETAPPSGPSIREEGGVVIIGSRPESSVVEEEFVEEEIVEEEIVEEEVLDEGASGDEADSPDPESEEASAEAGEGEAGEAGEPPDGEIAIEEEGVEGEVAAAEEADEETDVEGPSSSSETVAVFDFNGREIRQPGSQSSRRSEDGSENHVTLQSISGREVPYFSERETVLRETETEKSVEKTTQRYDPNGNPTQQEMVREETRKLPDGTVVTTATSYIENVNGRMEIVDRVITRRKELNGRIENLVITEKPSMNGGFQTIIREESIETKQGENTSTITTVRQVDDGGGRLVVAGREETVMRQSGNVSTTEKTVYERDALNAKMTVSSRTQGELVTNEDGSSTETVETYGHSLGDGSHRFLSGRSDNRLLRTITRETTLGADGETIETTHTRTRSQANPKRLTPTETRQKVRRPGANGETVETHVFEQTVSGRMSPTQVIVEQITK